jgi:hypothetical protein
MESNVPDPRDAIQQYRVIAWMHAESISMIEIRFRR